MAVWTRIFVIPLVVLGVLSSSLEVEVAASATLQVRRPYEADPTQRADGPARQTRTSRAELAVILDVVDGDTIRVRVGGQIDTVRLIGINSPEGGECFAGQAHRRLARLLRSGRAHLRPDVTNRDQYGRLLRFVWSDGRFVNEAMVRSGRAWSYPYPPDTGRQDALDRAERVARRHARGLWADDACGPAVPDEIAQAVDITDLVYDAPGDDHQNPNGEWVVIANGSSTPIDLGGWGLRDLTSSHRYEFPADFVLEATSSVRVHTGCGADTAHALYWCNNGAVWNNDGDTAFVTDSAGNVIAEFAY